MIVLYLQTKTLISFWCRRIEPKIFYSIIRDFNSLTNWNPPIYLYVICSFDIGFGITY